MGYTAFDIEFPRRSCSRRFFPFTLDYPSEEFFAYHREHLFVIVLNDFDVQSETN